MSIHPQVIEKEGKKEFVVLPYEEFIALTEAVEDYEDLRTLRAEKAESGHEAVKTLDEVLREIGDKAPQD